MDSELTKTVGGGRYTESKLVFFRALDKGFQNLSEHAYTFNNINVEIDKYLKDGWTPTNMCFSNGHYVVLFCR